MMTTFHSNKIKISIIIPIYNSEKYILDCLRSIKNQSLKEYEVICIDDGSNDNSIELCNSYLSENISNYDIIKINHSGVSIARNIGIERAKGDYIFFLDSDDVIFSKDVLTKLYDIANNTLCDVILTKFVNSKKNRLSKKIYNYGNMFSGLDLIKTGLINRFDCNPSLYFCRTSFLSDIRFVENIYMEDMVFFTDILLKSNHIYNSNVISIVKRNAENSITNSNGKWDYYNIIAFDMILDRLKDKIDDSLYHSYINQFNLNILSNSCLVKLPEYKKMYDECYSKFKLKYNIE